MSYSISTLNQKLEITEITQAQTKKMRDSSDPEYHESLDREIENRDLQIKDLQRAIKLLEAASL